MCDEMKQEIRKLAFRLNDAYKSMNDIIAEIESILISVQLPYPVWVAENTSDNPTQLQFGLAKTDKQWRIAYRIASDGSQNENEHSAVFPSTADIRRRCLLILPQLVSAVIAAAEQECLEIEHSLEQAKQILQEFKNTFCQ